jgi:hypothetical protein
VWHKATVVSVDSTTSVEPISVTVEAPSSGSDVWILLQRHMTTFASIGESTAADADPGQQNGTIKMAMRMLEDSSLGSESLSVALGNEGAVSPFG